MDSQIYDSIISDSLFYQKNILYDYEIQTQHLHGLNCQDYFKAFVGTFHLWEEGHFEVFEKQAKDFFGTLMFL